MRIAVALAVVLCLTSWCPAQTRPVEQEPSSLPKYLTLEEQQLPPLAVERGGRPPSGTVYCPPEYEPCQGIFFAWEGYTALLQQMTVTITTMDEETNVYMVVDSASEQTSVYNTLQAAGADMDQVQFVVRTTDTVWIRDYGPRFVFEDGQLTIIDHTYNRPRPNDNALNDYVSTLWGVPQYDLPLTHGGGNFHLFANGDAFMTTLILNENAGQTAQSVHDLYALYQGLDLTIFPGFPTSFDSTQHIDMWMLPTGDYTVIIGQYPSSSGQPYTITENATADLIARGYTVYRTPGWNSGGTHYTYTNATIINGHVFVPQFNHSNDSVAMNVFAQAFPGYTLHPIDCSGIIGAAGAVHCICMHVPAEPIGMRVTPAGDLAAEGPVGGPFAPASITYTIRNNTDASIDYAVTKSVAWLSLTNAAGTLAPDATADVTVSFNGAANALPVGDFYDQLTFTNLTTHDGDTTRDVNLTVGTPGPIYTYPLDSDPGWSTQGQWAFGQPLGQGGSAHGNPDPSSGATGTNVYGVNLGGDYATTVGGPWYVTLGPVDLSDVTDVELHFQRWLNTDYVPYASARIEVSINGATWQTLWQNTTAAITDASWQAIELLVPAADDQATVWFRWGYQISNGAYAYSGWNIDDIEIWGLRTSPPGCAGDANCDDVVNWRDIDFFVSAMNDNIAAWEAMFAPGAPTCPFANNDVDGDGTVNWRDIDPLVAVMNTVCP